MDIDTNQLSVEEDTDLEIEIANIATSSLNMRILDSSAPLAMQQNSQGNSCLMAQEYPEKKGRYLISFEGLADYTSSTFPYAYQVRLNEQGVCIGQSRTYTPEHVGSRYQWEVNTGSGYVPLNNNSNYSGVNERSRIIQAVSSSWYGNQYRCKVGGQVKAAT